MPLISERIPHFLGGVSQRADVQRDPSQGGRSINGLSHTAFGLMKRPPTRHGAVLSFIPTDWPGAYVYPIQTSFNERYRAIFTDGDMKIYNTLSGAEVPIEFPDGRAYLDTTGAAPNAAFRCVTIGDRTIVVNRNRTVQRATTLAPTQAPSALVVVVEANYDTSYTINLNGTPVSFDTNPPQTDGDHTLRTDWVATQLKLKIEASGQGSNFTVSQYGSTLHIVRQVAGTFDIEVHDGLADAGLLLIHPSVDRAEQLPRKAPDGFVAKVAGQKSITSDDTWYAYSTADSIWTETAEPGTLIQLLDISMPHELILNASTIDEELHFGNPQAPDSGSGAVPGSTLITPTFFTNRNGTGGLPSDFSRRFALGGFYDKIYVNLTAAGASGGDITFETFFDIDIHNLPSDDGVTIQLWVSDDPTAGSWTLIDDLHYPASGAAYVSNQKLGGTFNAVQDWDIKVEIVHDNGTPASGEKGFARFHLPSSGQVYCSYTVNDAALVTFPTAGVYPQGVQQTILLEGSDAINYTPSTDETGAQVAAGFAALIEAHASYTATASGTTITIKDDATPTTPPSAVWSTAFDNTTMYHAPGLALTPSGIVGSTLNNLTDGSTGTVTANTSTTVTVDDLTGGLDNQFDQYDSVALVTGAESFLFRKVKWIDRKAGALDTNPFPSFVDARISAAFYHRGRLGLCAGTNISMTEAGEYHNFFRTSVASLLDGDRIDVKAETQRTGTFFAGVSVGDQQLLFTDSGQYEITSGPLLTPATVGIRQVTSYLSAPQCDPAPLGRQVVFAFDNFGHVQAQLYGLLPEATRTFNAEDLTHDVPRLLEGNVRQIVGFTGIKMLVVLTNTDGGVGLPGLTSDPYLDPTAQVIPPPPPPAPPPLPPVGGNDVGLAGQAEQELFVEVETAVDVSVITDEVKGDTDALGSAVDAWAQATEGPLPDFFKTTQTEAASMTEVEGIEDTELFSDEIKSDSDSITPAEDWVQVIDGYTSAVITQSTSVQSNLQLCTTCQPPKFLMTATTVQFIQSGAQSVRERIYLTSQNGTLKRDTTYNVAPDNANWIFGSLFTGSEETEDVFTYWIELTPYLGSNLTGLSGTPVWLSVNLLNIV